MEIAELILAFTGMLVIGIFLAFYISDIFSYSLSEDLDGDVTITKTFKNEDLSKQLRRKIASSKN